MAALEETRFSWSSYSVAAADRLASETGLSPALATILARRGYDTPETARRFLDATERYDPALFGAMKAACRLILSHVERRSPIVVHGDYDVDGVCSTALLVRCLRALGADPSWSLPSRFDEGYGLSCATVERLRSAGCGLLITVDCGITAVEEVAHARALGLDVVVTDHHKPAAALPDCPVVHPLVGPYPCADLCATGVALKLSEALRAAAGLDPAAAEEDLDLVGLATVADVVPLLGENRRLVRAGLSALAKTRRPGLRALMRVAALDPGEVDARAVGFRLAPRLNAAGRLGRADAALELLLTDDDARAHSVADELDRLNHERRDAETRILFAAEAAANEQAEEPVVVVSGEGWHPGVIGIVASRLVERHHRPALVIALDREGGGRGSARSIGAYDLHAGLASCAGVLRRFGGHAMAAGFELEAARVDDLRVALCAHAATRLRPEDLLPARRIDAIVPGSALGMGLAEELDALAPFGQGNPEPTLLVPAGRLAEAVSMGDESQHARFSLESGGARARGVAFRTTAAALRKAAQEPLDTAVGLERREWNGVVEARVVLRGLRTTAPGGVHLLCEEPFWEAFERALGGSSVPAAGDLPAREQRDRRGEGFAGVAGELLSSGEAVLVACADGPRRRESLEHVVAGLAGPEGLHAVTWEALGRRPEIAAPFAHVVALDPAPLPETPPPGGEGFLHLAWGDPEIQFALGVAGHALDLRSPLTALYRELRHSPCEGPALERALGGDGRHPRRPEHAALLVRVLGELGLARYESAARACTLLDAQRTSLERSPTYRDCVGRLASVRARLGADGRHSAPEAVPAAA